ncbi:hypothetical protein [Nocardioides marinisabuli]|uniref:hypothetical protein n=1 Tax=Nocardioides marinisabuli TaxID=419476 RepID=UPI0015DDAF4F|nr:hypothetical protein [Nocardioides marinisabuli]
MFTRTTSSWQARRSVVVGGRGARQQARGGGGALGVGGPEGAASFGEGGGHVRLPSMGG